MIKDNQTSLNRFHVVLDALVTAVSYLLAWYLVIGNGRARMLGRNTLEPEFYFAALILIVPFYLILYSFFNLYTPKRVLGRRNEFGKILKANTIGVLVFGLVLYLGSKEPHLYNFSRRLVVYFYVINILLITAERNTIRIVLRSARSRGYNLKHILLVGYSSAAEGFVDRVKQNPEWGYQIRGILDDRKERGRVEIPVVGGQDTRILPVPPVQPVDERLRGILPHADERRTPGRPGRTCREIQS